MYLPAFIPFNIFTVTVTSHPRLFPPAELRSSSTHSNTGPADSDTVMAEASNTS